MLEERLDEIHTKLLSDSSSQFLVRRKELIEITELIKEIRISRADYIQQKLQLK